MRLGRGKGKKGPGQLSAVGGGQFVLGRAGRAALSAAAAGGRGGRRGACGRDWWSARKLGAQHAAAQGMLGERRERGWQKTRWQPAARNHCWCQLVTVLPPLQGRAAPGWGGTPLPKAPPLLGRAGGWLQGCRRERVPAQGPRYSRLTPGTPWRQLHGQGGRQDSTS